MEIKDFFEYCDVIALVNTWVESYGKGTPEVSDIVYDKEYMRIKVYEANNPDLIDPTSPTQNASDGNSDGFKKINHRIPMVSIANSMGVDELRKWATKKFSDNCNELTVEYKLDGAALSLHYMDGILIEAVTRGQHGVGDSVIMNAYQIESIPKKIQIQGRVEIRGEVVWLIKDFNAYNESLELEGKEPLSNPRNGAAGTLKQKDPSEVSRRKLTFIAYSVVDGSGYNTHREDLTELEQYGFMISPFTTHSNINTLMSDVDLFDKGRSNLEYLVDGLVIKVNDKTQYSRLGGTSKTPHYLTALKFPPEEKYTTLIDIEKSYGKSGAVTPVANVKTVYLALTNVNNASLHNWDMVEYLGIYKGCEVKMRKAGEIIPQVIQVKGMQQTIDDYEYNLSKFGRDYILKEIQRLHNDNPGIDFIKRPSKCGHCNSTLEQGTNRDGNELVAWVCPNAECDVKQYGRIVHFVSKNSMNIMGVGESLIESLLSTGKIKNISDLYKLSKDDLLNLPSVKERGAEKAISAINASRNVYLNQLLAGLGITNLGRTAANLIAAEYKTLNRVSKLTVSELTSIEGIGKSLALNIVEYFNSSKTEQIWKYFLDNNIATNAKVEIVTSDKLKGKVVIMTGKSDSIGRTEFKKRAIENGATIASSITKKVDIAVLGETGVGPAKIKKINELQAESHPIKTMSVEGFLDLIK